MSRNLSQAEKERLEKDIDCDVCWKRTECERATSGTFCGQFARKAPKDRGESPADAWARGEDSLCD